MDSSLLGKATTSDPSPTPGYMYNEIAKMTLSSYEGNRQVANYLSNKLRKSKNHNTKWKCLLIIKHVSLKGSPSFKRDMMREVSDIRDCLQFTGPPDPLRGDEIYKRVRDAAAEAIEAITSSDVPQQQPMGGMQSFSSGPPQGQPPMGGPPGGFGGGSRMEGFGSEPWDPSQAPQDHSRLGIAKQQAAALASSAYESAATGARKMADKLTGSDQSYQGGSFNDPRRPPGSMEGIGGMNNVDQRGRMAGIGTSMNKVGRSVRNMAFSGSSGLKDDLSSQYASNRGSNPYQGGGGAGGYNSRDFGGSSGYDDQRPDTYNNARSQPAFQWSSENARGQGAVGGVWGNMPNNAPGGGGGGANGSAAPPSGGGGGGGGGGMGGNTVPGTSSQHGVGMNVQAGGAAQDGEYERNLILELCAPGGTRAVPPKAELDRFLDKAQTLDAELVGPVLLDQLIAEGPWQVKSKVLAIVQALAAAPGCDNHVEFFRENYADIQVITGQKPASVASKAQKVLVALGVDGDGSIAASLAAAPGSTEPSLLTVESAPVEGETDLLGGLQQPTPPPPPVSTQQQQPPLAAPAPVATPPATGSGGSMFGSLSVKSQASPAPTTDPGSLLDMSTPEPPPATATPGAADLMGSLMVNDAAAAAPPAPTQQPPVDAFAGLDVTPAAPTVEPASGAVQPAMLPGSVLTTTDPLASAGQSGSDRLTSSMGDLNLLGSTGTTPMVMPGQPNAAGAMPGMPVGGGATAPNVAALQYQQMMMMQQMQMQQMQMAQYQQMQRQMQMGGNVPGGMPGMAGGNFMAGMVPVTQHRKIIPGEEAIAGGSDTGFDFLGGGGARQRVPSDPEDAFSFVKESMKR